MIAEKRGQKDIDLIVQSQVAEIRSWRQQEMTDCEISRNEQRMYAVNEGNGANWHD